DGTVYRVEGQQVAVRLVSGLTVRALAVGEDTARTGAPVVLSLRPERLALLHAGAEADNMLQATIRQTVYGGDHIRLVCTAEGVGGPAGQLVVKIPNRSGVPSLEPGAPVRLGWRAEDCLALAASAAHLNSTRRREAMSGEGKVIITCAVTGSIHTPTMSPYLPITPNEIVDAAVGASEAGASIIHLHARDPETGKPSPDPRLFMDFLPRIKQQTNAVMNISTGGGLKMTLEERLEAAHAAKPELCS